MQDLSRAARFADRNDAGRRLARELEKLAGENPLVLGLSMGGVPVAAEIARALGAPLDVAVTRRLRVPRHPEVAMGAIAEDGTRVLNSPVFLRELVTPLDLALATRRERAVLADHTVRLRGGRPHLDIAGRTVIVVDDGLTSGVSAEAACAMARGMGAARVVLAVPIATPEGLRLVHSADETVSLEVPKELAEVRDAYRDYPDVGEDEVRELLERAAPVSAGEDPEGGEDVLIPAGHVVLRGRFRLPAGARAVVVFARGSGSGRTSPRNRMVASVLERAGIGTLLLDLLTPAEEGDRHAVFDVPMLSQRLQAATAWVRRRPDAAGAAIGYFGASTGAGAALCAAAADPTIAAVVSRGGRPDLAGERLGYVRCPVLLIVGGRDPEVLGLNRSARDALAGEAALEVVPNATHLFEEPGALDQVAALARDWFTERLGASSRRPQPAMS
ncbi:phosphoribosyltransferase family protein [Naasia sp. SYSU D00057]|uniref:phosphoribosyltransferase family protein n=1 Tax=Naasia sp. SYSU D00057 TaxID=2817380 RepID=UPI001B310752|nr:phosphoribosyltransferase family protein [Naasia sp. SYSU D00057]